jgi:hypothetical protein
MRTVYDEEEKASADTEITLGMKSLLGVFFGSVLICAVFFGFGYSLGRNSLHPAVKAASASDAAVKPISREDAAAPAAPLTTVVSEDAAQQPQPESSPATGTEAATGSPSPAQKPAPSQYAYVPTPNGPARRPADPTIPPPARAKSSPAVAARPQPAQPDANQGASLQPAPSAAVPARPVAPAGNAATAQPVMVQISVSIRTEPADKLLHVQLGPFASRDEARAMRTRLLADGYNAILK